MGTKSLSNHEIVKCINHDPLILRRFIDSYGIYIMTVMRNILHNEDDVQECFWKFMEKLHKRLIRFDVNRDLKPFLWTIARNDALQKHGKDRNNLTIGKGASSIYDCKENSLQCKANIEKTLLHIEQLELTREVIRSFNNNDKDVAAFSLRLFRGFSNIEIAEIYDILESNAKNRVYRGLKKVKKEIRKMYPDYFNER